MGNAATIEELEALFKTPARLERTGNELAPVQREQSKVETLPVRQPQQVPTERWD